MKANYLVAVVVAVVVLAAAGGAVLYLRHNHPAAPPAAPKAPAAPAAQPAAAPPPPAPAAQFPAECLLPGPAPVPPFGATATEADMKLAHDAIQHFVLQLEGFQACRNAQIDHAPAGTTDARKEIWLQEGNAAVDEAEALRDAFSEQLKVFHARKK